MKKLVPVLVVMALAITMLMAFSVPAAADGSTGYAGNGSSSSGSGAQWTNPGNITEDDDSYATFNLGNYSTSRDLKGKMFGFAIPSYADIEGLEVTIGRYAQDPFRLKDFKVSLLNQYGSVEGDDKADIGTFWQTGETAVTYGGPSDTWGLALTPAIVNDQDFGAVLQVRNYVSPSWTKAYVDYMQMTVYYSFDNEWTQTWKLFNEDHPEVQKPDYSIWVMRQNGEPEGTATLGNNNYWLSEYPADGDVTFDAGVWKVHLNASTTDDLHVMLGYWVPGSGPGTGFNNFPGINQQDVNSQGDAYFNAGSLTIGDGQYLALKVSCHDYIVTTDGSSYLCAPQSTPDYPVPEATSAVLLGAGLLGMAGVVVYRRNRKVKES
ncbi:MAG: hypothetical protein JXA46_00860 [Dehalococcoidales bacterium]|nr:hypothetical protein [Dehalococcoidales bacterium]